MLAKEERSHLEAAGRELLAFILHPRQWVVLGGVSPREARPGANPAYQRKLGPLHICASVDVTRDLRAFLRVAFRAPGLTPSKAADCLEAFLKGDMPLLPNTEWQVTIDSKKWIHFTRRYAADPLSA